MALEGNLTANLTEILTPEVIENFSHFVDVLQALGIVIIAYLVFNIVNMIINRKKNKELRKINRNLEEIKKLLSKKKR